MGSSRCWRSVGRVRTERDANDKQEHRHRHRGTKIMIPMQDIMTLTKRQTGQSVIDKGP